MLQKYGVQTNRRVEELVEATQRTYAEQLSNVGLYKGFENFVGELRKNGLATTLATTNDSRIAQKVISQFNLGRFFDAVTTKEEVQLLKPAPDIFLAAAKKIRVRPEECLVIEDAPVGIEAAHRAGMRAIGIAREKERAELLKEAEFIISDYEGLTLGELLKQRTGSPDFG